MSADRGATMRTHRLTLDLLVDRYAIARLGPADPAPPWIGGAADAFVSVTRTPRECSIVCPEARVPADIRAERGWRLMMVDGPLPFEMTGVLASIAGPLAGAGVSLFAISTFDTDVILVRSDRLREAIAALAAAGHHVRGGPDRPEGWPSGEAAAAK